MHPSALCVVGVLTLILGNTVASPAVSSEDCSPRTLCLDGINSCGVRFGGCYDVCKPELRPVAPLCASATSSANVKTTVTSVRVTSMLTRTFKRTRTRHRPTSSPRTRRPKPTATITKTLVVTSTVPVTTPRVSTGKCPPGKEGTGLLVCADYISPCGMTYGGCFEDCKPWPTFVAPPCPSNTGTAPVKPIPA